METEKFKKSIMDLVYKIEDIIETMPDHGDTCETSQKICMRQKLNEFEWTVNGVLLSDLKPPKNRNIV